MNDQIKRMEAARKPKKCPECGKAPLASILYGMPIFSEALEQKSNEGRITFGGCCITDDDPAWECRHCGQQIFRKQG